MSVSGDQEGERATVNRRQFFRPLQGQSRLGEPPHAEPDDAELDQIIGRIVGVQPHGLPDDAGALGRPPRIGECPCHGEVTGGIVGIESDGALCLGDRLVMGALRGHDPGCHLMCQRRGVFGGRFQVFHGPLQGVVGGHPQAALPAPDPCRAVDRGEGGVGAAVGGIPLNGLLQKRHRLGVIGGRCLQIMGPAAQERIVGTDAGGFLPRLAGLFPRRQAHRQLGDDFLGHLVL